MTTGGPGYLAGVHTPLWLSPGHYRQSAVDRMPSADCLHDLHVAAHTMWHKQETLHTYICAPVSHTQDASKCEMKPINNMSSEMGPNHSRFRITYTIIVESTSCGLINEAIRYPLYPPFVHTHLKTHQFILFIINISFYKTLFLWKCC